MKVLQINSVYGVGSTGRIASDIHAILEKQGHESWIAYGRGEDKNCKKLIKIGNNFDNYTHVAKTRILDQHGFGSKKATEKFIEKVKVIDPDIIHLHNIHGYYINIEVLFKYLKEANKKVVWTLHDCWPFTGHCVHFEYVECDKWKRKCYSCPQQIEYPTSKLIDNSLENFQNKRKLFTSIKNMSIVTPSDWLNNLVNESFLQKYPVTTINNGIDVNTFKYKKSDFRKRYGIENEFVILGVARWDKRKGLEYLIKLAQDLNNEYKVVVVGLTNKQKEKLPKNIIALTQTNNISELVNIYSAADVYVNPTLEDNFPTTNLEAQACDVPVITFDTGGTKETVNPANSIVVEKGNYQSLLEAVRNMSKNKKNTNKLSDWITENFINEIKYKEYINLYKNFAD